MSVILYINLIIINIVVWLVLSYFWSFWSFKLFKPYKWLDKIKQKYVPQTVVKLERKFKDKNKFYAIWFELERIVNSNVEGDIAEVGISKGETAGIIHHILPDRKLFLCDDFSGVAKQVVREDCEGNVGPQVVNEGSLSKTELEKNIKGNSNVVICEGDFSETSKDLRDNNFCFVHLDTEFYQPTIDGLDFFYQRLSPGGSILIHDYNHNWDGVTKAVNEFEKSIPEQFSHIMDMYGSALLIKNKI